MGQPKYMLAIDAGTVNTKAVIADVTDPINIQIVGYALVSSVGIIDSVIVDARKSMISVREAVDKAQRMAGVRVGNAIVSITGSHIESLKLSGSVLISQGGFNNGEAGTITSRDIERAIGNANVVSAPPDHQIFQVIVDNYIVKNFGSVSSPVGLKGEKLTVKMHRMSGFRNSIKNLERCILEAGLGVREIVLESVASGFGVLMNSEMTKGVVVINFGGGTIDCAIFKNGAIESTRRSKYAGEIVTKDVSDAFDIPIKVAERLKVNYGNTGQVQDPNIEISVDAGKSTDSRYVTAGDLNFVVHARVEELLESINDQLKEDNSNSGLSGIVLTGGSAQLKGIKSLSEQVFGLPVRIGVPATSVKMEKNLCNPIYSTCVGLVRYGLINNSEATNSDDTAFSFRGFGKNIERLYGWFTN
ncbi:MAG: cell division protein FtsA [Calditrichaeota bacterium]|nr:cell division protein FtsA [Calditrichota bacterium]MBT7619401.1 cell division protein FtsA [Calditrichota bacterium]MBT7789198.1 cell division protein FtsA [Calditrichota bacterium]